MPPDVGDRLVIVGVTTNCSPLLGIPFTVTTTLPVVTPEGAGTTIFAALQLVGVPVTTPLNVTVLEPWDAPKRLPLTVTDVAALPEVGEMLVMIGADVSVNVMPLLCRLLTTTTTGPVPALAGTGTTMVVAFQLVGVATAPLNNTALVPWLEPKLVPVIVTEVPGVPEVVERLVMLGANTTVNAEPLVATPPTVTTTLPVVAPVGTAATIRFADQFEIDVAAVPLNVTVLGPWIGPKPIPEIITEEAIAPADGER
jgi:hypothetical protein